MAEPFIAELRLFSFGFPPKGWALCNGQLLPINQNQPLFSLLGTTYGGDGRVTFGLPNLQGRIPAHFGKGFTQGGVLGETAHTLTISEMPAHNHIMAASSQAGGGAAPNGAIYADVATVTGFNAYSTAGPGPAMNPGVIPAVGGSQPHLNAQPFLVLNWCIALQGIFPSQN
jgi:microcystin-dependent protein